MFLDMAVNEERSGPGLLSMSVMPKGCWIASGRDERETPHNRGGISGPTEGLQEGPE